MIWTNSWYDPGKEREAANTLISQGADVLTNHTDSPAIVQAAEEKGKYASGYHSDMSKYGPKAQLSSTMHVWGDFYTKATSDVLAGTWKTTNVWGGMKDGMISSRPRRGGPGGRQGAGGEARGEIRAGTLQPFAVRLSTRTARRSFRRQEHDRRGAGQDGLFRPGRREQASEEVTHSPGGAQAACRRASYPRPPAPVGTGEPEGLRRWGGPAARGAGCSPAPELKTDAHGGVSRDAAA